MSKRIGLTMRVTQSEGYHELRDSLARDWIQFMDEALPEFAWLPIPNLGEAVGEFIREWRIEGFILTGGNHIGEDPARDVTERAVLAYAMRHHFPVFGVCRGLQLIQTFFGGALQTCDREAHVGVCHELYLSPLPQANITKTIRLVNSYHTKAVAFHELAPPLRPFAVSDDGWAEGIFHPEAPLLAVQWHPERFHPFSHHDQLLMRQTLGLAA